MVWSAPFSPSITWKEILRVLHQPSLHVSSMKHRYSLVMGVPFSLRIGSVPSHVMRGRQKSSERSDKCNYRQNVPQLSSNTCFSPKQLTFIHW